MPKTTEEFKKEVYDLVGNEYTVLGEYINNKTKIKMKHNICNNVYEVTPTNFLHRKNRCPDCSLKNIGNKYRKTTEEFKKEVYDLVNDEYTVLGEYINNKTKIKMKHKLCNNVYEVKPNYFLNGTRCPLCSKKLKKTTESFKQEVYKLVGNEYTVLGEYINNSTKIKMKHNICNSILNKTPNKFLQGDRCPLCSKKLKKTTEEFKKEVFNLVGDEYTVLGEYINNSTKIKMKHNICNFEYEVRPVNFLTKDNRCPKCKRESKGELKIKEYLDNKNIKYIKEKRFKNCKYKNYLPFDFYLEEYNLCIEFDGKQHFDKNTIFYKNDKKEFELQKKRDLIKNEFCNNSNINLLRIPYTDICNIETILDKKLSEIANSL